MERSLMVNKRKYHLMLWLVNLAWIVFAVIVATQGCAPKSVEVVPPVEVKAPTAVSLGDPIHVPAQIYRVWRTDNWYVNILRFETQDSICHMVSTNSISCYPKPE